MPAPRSSNIQPFPVELARVMDSDRCACVSTWLHTGSRIGTRSGRSYGCSLMTFRLCSCTCCIGDSVRCLGRIIAACCRNHLSGRLRDIWGSIVSCRYYIQCLWSRWVQSNPHIFMRDTSFCLGTLLPFHTEEVSCTFFWPQEAVLYKVLTIDPMKMCIPHLGITLLQKLESCKWRTDVDMKSKTHGCIIW